MKSCCTQWCHLCASQTVRKGRTDLRWWLLSALGSALTKVRKNTSWDPGPSVTSYSFLTPRLSTSWSRVEYFSLIEQWQETVVPHLLSRSGFKPTVTTIISTPPFNWERSMVLLSAEKLQLFHVCDFVSWVVCFWWWWWGFLRCLETNCLISKTTPHCCFGITKTIFVMFYQKIFLFIFA